MRDVLLVLLLAVNLAACAEKAKPSTPKDRECKSFLATAREGQAKLNAPLEPVRGQSSLAERGKRYRAYADELEAVLIRDTELDKLRDEYVAHIRGSAQIFETVLGDPSFDMNKVAERDQARAELTARINTYCGLP